MAMAIYTPLYLTKWQRQSDTFDFQSTNISLVLNCLYVCIKGTAVAQWLRCCTTTRKVAGSIPAGVIGIFH